MPLLDRFTGIFTNRTTTTQGVRPEQPRRVGQAEAARVIGHMGTSVYGGYVTSREKNARLTGQEKYRTYSEILANITTVAAGVRFYLALIAKAKWNVEPADVSGADAMAEATRIADLTQDIMYDMQTPWARATRRMAMYRFYGYSVQEWTAKRRPDGVVGYLDLAPRPQITIERWDLDVTGQVIGCVQRSEQTSEEIYLPRNKLAYIVDDSLNDSPEGLGLFRHLAEAAQRLRVYEELEGFGFEADTRGIPILRAPISELDDLVEAREISSAQKNHILQGFLDFQKNHIKTPELGILMDSDPYRSLDEDATPSSTPKWDVSLLEGAGTQGQRELLEAIERVHRELARVLSVEQLLLGDGDGGSMALSRDKSNNFRLVVDSALQEIAQVMQRDFVGPLMRMNGWDDALTPTLKPESIRSDSPEQIAAVIRDLSVAGAPIDRRDELVGEIYDLLGLSAPAPDMMEADMLQDRAVAGAMADRMMSGSRAGGADEPVEEEPQTEEVTS